MKPLALLCAFAVLSACGPADPVDATADPEAEAVAYSPAENGLDPEPVGSGARQPDRTAQASGSTPDDSTLDRLAGAWRSNDDPSVLVRFDGDLFGESYDGSVVFEGTVTVLDGCSGPPDPVGAFFQVTDRSGERMCYAIVSVSEETLAYSLVGGRGSTLSFVRNG